MPDQNEENILDQEMALVRAPMIEISIPNQIKELTTETSREWVQNQLIENMPTLAPALFEGWKNAMVKGNTQAMRDVAEVMGLLQPKGGINILNQVNNNNVSQGGFDGPSLESIIRNLRKSKQDSGEIIDAEIIEPDAKG